jgi:hypothetical protein
MRPVRELAERLIEIPGVVAVALGGSRAGGSIHPDSDWDFGLYYRAAIGAEHVRVLGFEGRAPSRATPPCKGLRGNALAGVRDSDRAGGALGAAEGGR